MDKELLKQAGTLIYGPKFQRPMARELGVSDRTVRRWLAGDYEVSNDHASRLLVLLDHRSQRIIAVQNAIGKMLKYRYRQYRLSLR